MNDYDYKDPDFGFFDDVIELASFTYDAWVQTGVSIDDNGMERTKYKKIQIRGSLQTYRKTMEYTSSVGVITSSRDGKLYVRYDVPISEGDIVRKGTNYFRVTNPNDHDYAGVKNFDVVRLGLAEQKEFITLVVAKPFE